MLYYDRWLQADDAGLAVEGADLGGEGVEVMKTGVGAGGRDAVDGRFVVQMPGGEDEEAAVGAGLEARLFGLPIRADGLGL